MYWVLIFISVQYCVKPSWAEYQFTNSIASRCKKYDTHEYRYRQFFDADPVYRQTTKEDGLTFEMHMAVKAPSDGHVLLSKVAAPGSFDPVYEIVIGGGNNTFMQLRKNLRRNSKAQFVKHGVLSSTAFVPFYIKVHEGGFFEFGQEGEQPLLSYLDTDPFTVRYFSFTSWLNVNAEFLFDCPTSNENGSRDSPTDSKEVQPNLTPSEALKRSLLQGRSPFVSPDNVSVNMDMTLTFAQYDTYASKLTSHFRVIASWKDDGMAWNPDKFNGTKTLKFAQGQIWTPMLHISNSLDNGLLLPRNPDLLYVSYNGDVVFRYNTQINIGCQTRNYATSWPSEEYDCLVEIAPWRSAENHKLNFSFPEGQEGIFMFGFTLLYKDIQKSDDIIATEWHVIGWHGSSKLFGKLTDDAVLQLKVSRRGTSYLIAFHTPLFVLVSFLLTSFWSERLTMSRVWFLSGIIVLICVGLSYIDYFVPVHVIPSILVLYIFVLGGTLLALFIQILLISQATKWMFENKATQFLLTSNWCRTCFGLPVKKTCEHYDNVNRGFCQEEDDTEPLEPSNPAEEMFRDPQESTDKEDVAEIIDKVLFVGYSVGFAVLLVYYH